ncbi:LutB/LldF family L-lactate oxidation iron-sulfur protein [Oceanithermus sp.]
MASGYKAAAKRALVERPEVRSAVTKATLHFDGNRARAYGEIDAEAWRDWAAGVKRHLLGRLDRYLEEAEAGLRAHGAVVHWAENAADVQEILRALVADYGVSRVVKGKSMLSEEVEVNPLLESLGVEVFETDLGEYIIQLAGEPPSHIVGPAIHKGLEEIRALFHEKLGTPADAEPTELAAAARRVLRDAFLSAEMGISGANFVVAETGTVVLVENEGNIRLTTSAPRVHVALVGIEKLLPRFGDLEVFLQLLARAATGQKIGTFVSLINGPRREGEPDGPEHLHVIFVDNGRSSVLADDEMYEALSCIRCGACLNACPVYRQTGGHAYGQVYSGPIGVVLTPGLKDPGLAAELGYACSLCTACADVCPVRIPLPGQILAWRRRSVERGLVSGGEKLAFNGYAAMVTRPRFYRLGSKLLRLGKGLTGAPWLPVLGAWAAGHGPLEPSPKSFREIWEEELAGE